MAVTHWVPRSFQQERVGSAGFSRVLAQGPCRKPRFIWETWIYDPSAQHPNRTALQGRNPLGTRRQTLPSLLRSSSPTSGSGKRGKECRTAARPRQFQGHPRKRTRPAILGVEGQPEVSKLRGALPGTPDQGQNGAADWLRQRLPGVEDAGQVGVGGHCTGFCSAWWSPFLQVVVGTGGCGKRFESPWG